MKNTYLWDRDKELTTTDIVSIVQSFQTSQLPRLEKLKKYYDGHMAIDSKQYSDSSKPISRICVNFCHDIVSQYNGYITGVPIAYSNDDFRDVIDVLNYNDTQTEDSELLKQALIYGVGYELNYMDLDAQQRFKVLDSRQVIPVYSDDLQGDLLYVIRFWFDQAIAIAQPSEYYIEVYGAKDVRRYHAAAGFTSINLIEELPNYYNQVPVSVLTLNAEQESIFEQIMGLNDAYNELISSQIDDYTAFVDSYLVFNGAVASTEDIQAMKEERVIMLDNDATAAYLTKDIGSTGVNEMLTNYKQQIYQKSSCFDTTDANFAATSGIALRYKLIAFENAAAVITAQMKKCLQKRIELICSILSLTVEDFSWRDVTITFTRNLPDTLTPSTTTELMQLEGLVSKRTLLSLLPFVKNVDEELEAVNKEREESMSLYDISSFGVGDKQQDELLEQ